jgi:hypothetical protein
MEIANSGEKWNTKLFRILNSAMSFCIAYIFLTIGDFFSKSFSAKVFGIKNTVYFHGVRYFSEYKDWYPKSSIVIHSSGLVFVAVSSVISWALLRQTTRFDTPVRMIFLWTYVIGICMICAQFMSAAFGVSDYHSPFAIDFTFTIAWLYIKPPIAFMIAGFMVIVMAASTFFIVRPFLLFAYSYRKVYKLKARRKFFYEIAIIPCFIGVLFTTTLIFPEKYIFVHLLQSLYILAAMLIGWYILFYVDVDYDAVWRHTGLEKVNFTLIALLIAATVFTQTVLQKGVSF